MRPWRHGTGAALALLLLLAGSAGAADSDSKAPAPPPRVAACARAASFRTIVDVGHTADVPGALSARGLTEYEFNLALATEIDKELRAAGFDKTVLIDKGTMREFDASCLTVVEPLSAKETPPLSSRKPPKAAIRDP